MDPLGTRYTGREPVTALTLHEAMRVFRLSRLRGLLAAASPIGVHHMGGMAQVYRGGTITGSGNDLVTELGGDIALTPCIGAGGSWQLQPSTLSASTGYVVSFGLLPSTGAATILSRYFIDRIFNPATAKNIRGIVNQVGAHTNSAINAANYSLAGPWLDGVGRPRTQLAMYLYMHGKVSGGTYRLAYNGNWTANLAWNATPSTVAAALAALPGLSAGLYVGPVVTPLAAGTGMPPFLFILIGDTGKAIMNAGVPFSVDSTNLTGEADALARPAGYYCASVRIPRSPGARFQYVLGAPSLGHFANEAFQLTFNGQQTALLPIAATAAQVQSALEALSTVGAGNVAVYALHAKIAGEGIPIGSVDYPQGVATGQQAFGFRVAFLGALEDTTHLLTYQKVSGNGSFTVSNSHRGVPSLKAYWNDSADQLSIDPEVRLWTHPCWDEAVVPVWGLDWPMNSGDSAQAIILRHLVCEFGYPGGLVRHGVAEGTSAIVLGGSLFPHPHLSTRLPLNWEGTFPELLEETPTRRLPYLSSAYSHAGGEDPLNNRGSMQIGLSRPGGVDDTFRQNFQRPSLTPWKMTQICVISDAVGRPIGLADGYLLYPDVRYPTHASAHGTRAYVWMDYLNGASTNPILIFEPFDGDTITRAFRCGSGILPGLLTGRQSPLPTILSPTNLAGGAIADEPYTWTVRWLDDGTGNSQVRTVDELGFAEVGQIRDGVFVTGPALGGSWAQSRQSTVIIFPAAFSAWCSEAFEQDGYVCWLDYGAVYGSVGTNHGANGAGGQFNVPFPARLNLSAVAITEEGQADTCLEANLSSVTLETNGVDLRGEIAYGTTPEYNSTTPYLPPPDPNARCVGFDHGIAWHGTVPACGSTLWFQLVLLEGDASYVEQTQNLLLRLYVYADAIPVWPPPHELPWPLISPPAPTVTTPQDNGSRSPKLLAPGLIGVSNYSYIQRPLEGAPFSGAWTFHVPVGSFGRPAGSSCTLKVTIAPADTTGWSYPLTNPDCDCPVPSPVIITGGSTDVPTILGTCCDPGDLRLTLTDSSGGVYPNNLFSRFISVSGRLPDLVWPHARVWLIGGVSGLASDIYLAILMPNADESYSLIFASYNYHSHPLGSTTQFTPPLSSGICQYAPLNAPETSGGIVTGGLTWNGLCATFSASGVIRLHEPGVGDALITAVVTL